MSVRALWWLYGGFVGLMVVVMLGVLITVPSINPNYNRTLRMVIPTQIPLYDQVIAAQDIPAGTTITSDMLTVQPVTVDIAVRNGYSDVQVVVGKAAKQDILRTQPITELIIEDAPQPFDIRATATRQAAIATPYNLSVTPTAVMPLERVVYPQYDLPAGTLITASDVAEYGYWQNYPQDIAPASVYTNSADVIGKVARVTLPRAYPITSELLIAARDPAAPTPLPLPSGACSVGQSSFTTASLYESPRYTNYIGTFRIGTNAIVVEEDDVFYRLELVDGTSLGWVYKQDITTNGNCSNIP